MKTTHERTMNSTVHSTKLKYF